MSRTMGRVEATHEQRFYECIVQSMLGAGYTRASAWCFSRRQGMFDEYIVERDEYVGLGSGAFSYVQGSLYASTFSIAHYLAMIEAGRSGTFSRRALSEADQARYYLLMRLFSGQLDKRLANARFDGRFRHKLWPELTALQSVRALRDTGEELVLTERGYYLWVVLMREFFSGINNLREQLRNNAVPERPVRLATE